MAGSVANSAAAAIAAILLMAAWVPAEAACGPDTVVDPQQALARATAAADRAALHAHGAGRARDDNERASARAEAERWLYACQAALESSPNYPMPQGRDDAVAAGASLRLADDALADSGTAERLAREREAVAARARTEAQRQLQHGKRRAEIEAAQIRSVEAANAVVALREEGAALRDAADGFACHAAKLVAGRSAPPAGPRLRTSYCRDRFDYALAEQRHQVAAAQAAGAGAAAGVPGLPTAQSLLAGTLGGLLQEKHDPHIREERQHQRDYYGREGRRVPLSEDDIALLNLAIPIGNPALGQAPPAQGQQAAAPPPVPSRPPETPKAPPTPKSERPVSGFAVAPDVPKRVCGPDITSQVFNTLDKIYRDYHGWSAAQQKEKCDLLVSVTPSLAFEGAWDIDRLSPDWAPDPKKEDAEEIAKKKYWFENVSPSCAIPRDPCGPSVTFLGQCLHAQVVNYVMWGAINLMCGQKEAGERMHRARQVAKNFPDLTQPADPYGEQKAMADIGEGWTALREQADQSPAGAQPVSGFVTGPTPGSTLKPETPANRQQAIDFLKRKLPGLLKDSSRPERLCQIPCPATADELATMASTFHYHWGKSR
ncbi:MAG: hypothetical protein L6R19_22790 [Alphaproteobacteria bacterium]|nr:hypothetical protein [Alphaproteobacteria bacterium]